jgi:hypothetical protein
MKKIFVLAGNTLLIVFFAFTVSAQAPNLGAASTFAWFTATGALTNTGTTVIYGDIGTGTGLYSGGPTVFGNVHLADAVAVQAAMDVQAAYTAMSGLMCDSIMGTPFGNGLVLAPGRVYCITMAAQLQGELIMDAKGDSSAIFILKINGALSTAVGSSVSLINGANFCNVYWQVAGAVSISEQVTFLGTILADGEITLLNLATLEGRGLSRTGAMHLNSNQVIGCDPLGASLPITLIYFRAHLAEAQVELRWATATELNNNYFTVERSLDARSFEEIIRLPGAGNSTAMLHYTYTDHQPLKGTSYYRLRQTDYDGQSSFSNTVAVHQHEQDPFYLYPNPFKGSTTFVLNENIKSEGIVFELKVYTMLGETVIAAPLRAQYNLMSANHLPPGIYHFRIFENSMPIQSGRLIVIQ